MFKNSVISLVFFSVSRLIIGFFLTKLVVLNFGSRGLGIYSQFQGLLIFLMQFVSVGAASGVINLASTDFTSNGKKSFMSSKELLLFGAVISFIFLIIAIFFENQIRLRFLLGSFTALEYYLMVIFILLFHSVSFWNSVRIGFREGSIIIKNGFWVAFLGLMLVLLFNNSIKLLLFAGSLYYIGQIIGSMLFDRRFYLSLSESQFSIQKVKATFHKLSPFLVMAFFSGIGQPLVNIFIRDNVNTTFGGEFLGHWQGIVRISDALSQIFAIILTYYLLPRLTAEDNDSAIRQELMSFIKRVSPIIISSLVIIWLFSDFILKMLYDQSFLEIGHLINFQLMGDLVRFFNYTLAQVIISKASWRLSIAADILISVLLLSSYLLLKSTLGLNVVVISYFIAHCIYALFLYFAVLRKLNSHAIYCK